MKLIDLFEQQKVIEGDVVIPMATKKLDYYGVTITGNFECSGTAIKSLKGAPKKVGGDFRATNTAIKSLEGAPSYVGGSFNIGGTEITSLEGAPSYIGINFYCNDTDITSFHNVHKIIKYIGGTLWLPRVQSHILGVMFIRGLKHLDFWDSGPTPHFGNIINKYLEGNRNPHECQEELIDAGFSEFAKI